MTSWMEAYMDAWSSHDGPSVAEFMAEDVSYETLATHRVYEGRQAIVGYVEDTHAGSEDYRFTLVDGFQSGDSFCIEWEMDGTHTGEAGGVEATNRKIHLRGVSVGRLDDHGKIKVNRDYHNLLDFLVQAGVLPTPG